MHPADPPKASASLKRRILLSALAVILLSVSLLAFVARQILRSDMERVLGDQQAAAVALVSAEIEANFRERTDALNLLASGIGEAQMQDPRQLQQLLEQRKLALLLFNAGIYITDRSGTAVAEVPVIHRVGVNYIERDYIAIPLREARSVVGQPVVGKQVKAPTFAISVPIRDAQGLVIGALAGVTDLSRPNFLGSFTAGRYGRSGGYFIVDPRSRLFVTATADNRSRVMQPLPPVGANAVLDRRLLGFDDGPVVNVNSLGVEVLSSSARIPAAGWLVVATLPTAEAFAPLQSMERSVLAAAALVLLLGAALMGWRLNRLLAPLEAAAGEVLTLNASGTTPVALPLAADDEVGQLIRAINRMLAVAAQREDVLRASEARFRGFFEHNTSVLLLIDPADGCITDANAAAVAYYGRPREALLGLAMSRINVLPPERIAQEMQHAVRDGHGVYQFRHQLASGAVRDVEVHSTPIRSEGRTLLFSIVHDVTDRAQAQRALERSEADLRRILEVAGDAIFISDLAGHYRYVNDQACALLGYTRDELLARTLLDVVPPADLAATQGQFSQVIEQRTLRTDLRMTRQDGRVIFVDLQATLLPGGRVLGACRDSTERHQREDALRVSEAVLQTMQEGVCLIQASTGQIVFSNPKFDSLFGYAPGELLGRAVSALNAPSDRSPQQRADALIAELALHGSWQGDIQNQRKDGTPFWCHAAVSTLPHHRHGSVWVAVHQDITARVEASDTLSAANLELESMALQDALTGLFNRRGLNEMAERQLAQAQRAGEAVSFVMLDIDHFKRINDAHGHQAGDAVIAAIGQLLQQLCRGSDTASRYGGEEFMLVLPGADAAVTLRRAEQIRAGVAALRVRHGAQHLRVTASLGIASHPAHGQSVADLIECADRALYAAKQAGRDAIRLATP